MILSKIILLTMTSITPAEMIEEEEMQLTKKVALIEDEEVCDGELVFEDDSFEEEEEYSDTDQQ